MKHYYIADRTALQGFVELTEADFYALIGTDEVRPYAAKVYRGELSIAEVPEELRDMVESVVNNRVARWGLYEHRDISDRQALDIITGGDGE